MSNPDTPAELLDKWREDLKGYPKTGKGPMYARTTLKLCIEELEEVVNDES